MKPINHFPFYTPVTNKLFVAKFILVILTAALVTACSKSKNTEETPKFGTCTAVAIQGHLSYSASANTYTYRTNGGGTIKIELSGNITISWDSYPGFKIDFWGGVTNTPVSAAFHENLNGKHVKDRINARRTIVFPDGAKVTFVSDMLQGPTRWINIFDGGEMHHINMNCSTLEYSITNNPSLVQRIDNEEADGEAATFEISSTGLLYLNIYTEDVAGNKINNRVPIGELSVANPNMVNDYWP